MEEVEVKPFRWSFSQWETYDTCPARWKFKSVDRLPTSPPGPAAARGLDMHDRVENYIIGAIDQEKLLYGDPEMRFGTKKPAIIHEDYLPVIDAYRDHPNGDRHVEYKMAFDSEWYLTGPATKFSACVAVLDAVRFEVRDGRKILHIGEWKSGTPKDRHADQRKLYCAFGLKGWLADEVICTTYYLEGNDPPSRLIVKDTAWEKLTGLWSQRRNQMQNDKLCSPRPGQHCNWCDFAASRGGPCKFGR